MLTQRVKDGIDLLRLPFADATFAEIEAAAVRQDMTVSHNSTRIDLHGQYEVFPGVALRSSHLHQGRVHAVPDFYRALVPLSGEAPTPSWTVQAQFDSMDTFGTAALRSFEKLELMRHLSIGHSVLSLPAYHPRPGDGTFFIGFIRLIKRMDGHGKHIIHIP